MYHIVVTKSAVYIGNIDFRDGHEVELTNARNIKTAEVLEPFDLLALAAGCIENYSCFTFSTAVPQLILEDVQMIIPCTDVATKQLNNAIETFSAKI